MLALLTADHFEDVQARRRAWGADKLDEVWTGIPHLGPVGEHSSLQQQIALLLRPAAGERGQVAVLGAYEPLDIDAHRDADPARPGFAAIKPRPRRWPSCSSPLATTPSDGLPRLPPIASAK